MRPPESWSRARVTLVLTLATAAAWILLEMLRLQGWAAVWGGFIPARFIVEGEQGLAPAWLTPLTAAFVHANFIHLALNLVILAFCGRPTEAVVGPAGLAILYLLGAYAAAGAQYLVDPADMTPMIGASGAISSVLGAYAILFGRNKVKVSNPTLALWLNALWLMAAWIVLQLIVGISFAQGGLQIAIAAHIGGFLVGVALANPLLRLRYRNA
jgi:membrane associated rhomboid family serine protease